MERKISENAVLDFAAFHVSWPDNSYETLICSNCIMEKLDGGPLDQLATHLTEARESCSNPSDGTFKLQLDASIESPSWFTKFTLERFLHVVNVPNALKLANAIMDEIQQLEETKRFHIALYAKQDNSNQFGGGGIDVSYLNDLGSTQQIKAETASFDATKNELLRAMDLRLTALKEELVASFSYAAGASCCSSKISDLASFAQHFGAVELSNVLLKILEVCPNNLHFDTTIKPQTSLNDSGNVNLTSMGRLCLEAKHDVFKPEMVLVSPAKVAQAERLNSSESEDSSDSSDTDSPNGERSRPVVRSATPRRSASPMRRVQIGRSGPRKSTAITIKSLNFYSSREKAVSSVDADRTNSVDDEVEFLPKKAENNLSRMSVQDAISLFERKQKDETSDIQTRKTGVSISTSKSVLRRWSAGMGDSFNYSTQEQELDYCHQIAPCNLDREAEEKKEDDLKEKPSNPETIEVVPAEIVREGPFQGNTPEPVVTANVLEVKDCTSAEWNQQKEAELNEMLMKMMERNNFSKYRHSKVNSDGFSDTSADQRGGLYTQYREKRDEKLRSENIRNLSAKQAQFKVMHETLEQSKAAMVSKTGKPVVKPESAVPSQKPRRNSAPAAILKKEVSKTSSTKNLLLKSSSLKTENALPSGPLKRRGGTPPAKSSLVVSSSGSTPSRQRPPSSNSIGQPSPRSVKSVERVKGNKSDSSVQTAAKPRLKRQEDKQLKQMAKNNKAVNPRSSLTGEDCGEVSKPSLPSKYTKKSSVVPVESKPFLRKGSGINPSIGVSAAKAKEARVPKSGDSLKNSGNIVHPGENDSISPPVLSTMKVTEDDLGQTTVVDDSVAAPPDNDVCIETAENNDGIPKGTDNVTENSMNPLIAEIQHDDDLGISSAAWVETEHQEYSPSRNNRLHGVSPTIAPVASSSLRVRHSLSQMLQTENGEPEIIEWGNAENPPSLVYQKDVPKGFKRLLKFTRKSKGEGNSTGWSSPSIFSEGEEELEESKAANKTLEALQRKASHQAKGYEQPTNMASESYDFGNSSKRSMDYWIVHDASSGSDRLRGGGGGGHKSTGTTTAATASKATRSFFSLSSFRSSKANR